VTLTIANTKKIRKIKKPLFSVIKHYVRNPQKKSAVMCIVLPNDNVVVIYGVVLSGMSDYQAAFVFITCFSVYCIDWTFNFSGKSMNIEKFMEFFH
jgi:hypothetical protein